MSQISFNVAEAENGQKFVTVFANGVLTQPADDTHPNFAHIVASCEAAFRGEDIDPQDVLDLFDVAATVSAKFERLSDRVSVKNGVILLDGDPVHGTLQDQILAFLDAGEDFAPLVNFYEKLLTNPLGDVRAGLYDWIQGQTAEGALTITPEGNLLGYKSVHTADPEWRTDETVVYRPSRRGEGVVNGRDVSVTEFIEQVPGDVVEMPRSKVLHSPSQECGDGLHIGTWNYAKGFQGDTVLLVEFNPRDIVSLPDRNSSWKLRVCRYTVVKTVNEPLDVPVYATAVDPSEPGAPGNDERRYDESDLDVSLRDEFGRFHKGRPGSQRGSNGRFVG